MKKFIIFAVLVSVLVVALIVPSAAVLPSSPADSTVQYVSQPFNKDDVQLLVRGLRAQSQLDVVPLGGYTFWYLTMTKYSDSLYYYTAYFGLSNLTFSFYSSAGVANAFDLGMYAAASGSCQGISRLTDLTATGGLLGKNANTGYFYKTAIAKYGFQLADQEIVVAYWDSSSESVVTPAPDEYYTQSYTDTDGTQLYKLTQMRNMANSWIAARDAKAGNTTSSGGTYSEGYEAGYEDGKEDGYDEGKSDGYDEGVEAGSTSGYQNGYAAGSADGYDRGYEKGDKAGYDRGYSEGVLKADQGAQIDIAGVISAVPTAARTFLDTAFNFELFGINIAGLMTTLIIAAIAVFGIRWLMKK